MLTRRVLQRALTPRLRWQRRYFYEPDPKEELKKEMKQQMDKEIKGGFSQTLIGGLLAGTVLLYLWKLKSKDLEQEEKIQDLEQQLRNQTNPDGQSNTFPLEGHEPLTKSLTEQEKRRIARQASNRIFELVQSKLMEESGTMAQNLKVDKTKLDAELSRAFSKLDKEKEGYTRTATQDKQE